MTQLNLNKLSSIDNADLVNVYQSKLANANHIIMMSDLKIQEFQNLIQKIYNEHPEAIPAEYLIEEDKHVNDK